MDASLCVFVSECVCVFVCIPAPSTSLEHCAALVRAGKRISFSFNEKTGPQPYRGARFDPLEKLKRLSFDCAMQRSLRDGCFAHHHSGQGNIFCHSAAAADKCIECSDGKYSAVESSLFKRTFDETHTAPHTHS